MPQQTYAHLHIRELYRDSQLAISDACCRAPRSGWMSVEAASALQLILPRRGVFELRVRGEDYVGDPNGAFLIEKTETCQYRHPTGHGDDCLLLTFEDTFADALRAWIGQRANVTAMRHAPAQLRVSPAVQFAAARLRWSLLTRSQVSTEVHASLNYLLAELAEGNGHIPAHSRVSGRRLLTPRARLLLASSPHAHWSLATLAQSLDSSPFHIAKLFRGDTGVAPHRFKTTLRLASALQRLAESDETVTTVALDLGFSSAAHFAQRFRAAFGVTPTAFRRDIWGCP